MTERACRVLRAVRGCRAVAFDVFDTLLWRALARPGDLFAWMEATGRAPAGFAAARMAAERAARAVGRAEVRLADIYARPELAGCDPAAELAAEAAVLRADPDLLTAARRCHARGQRVYAISDIYLPEAAVAALLRRCGYDFLDGVFVSARYGVQKRDGRLFRLFLRRTALSPAQVLFVGDDARADALGAALAGLRCRLLPAPPGLPYTPQPQPLAAGIAWATARRCAAALPPDAARGAEVLGPLLTGFTVWLHEQRRQTPVAQLLFLARDMGLTRRLYRRLYPQEEGIGYLQVSRRSLCPALLLRPPTPQNLDLLAAALPRQRLTAAQALRWCGFAPDALPAATLDLKTRPLDGTARAFLRRLFALAAAPAGAAVRRQGRAALRYLEQQDIRPGTLLVDIGSGGTTQRLLQALTGVPLRGLYLACDERLPAEDTAVWLFDGRPAPLWYWAGQPLLERLISAPGGTVIGYRADAEGRMRACRAPQPPMPRTVADWQRGALAFAAAWRAGPGWALTLPAAEAAAPLARLIRSPRAAETARLGDLTVEDGGVWTLAAPRPAAHYLAHPAELGRDLGSARWKAGFCRRLLPLPLPYGAVYEKLKSKEEKP